MIRLPSTRFLYPKPFMVNSIEQKLLITLGVLLFSAAMAYLLVTLGAIPIVLAGIFLLLVVFVLRIIRYHQSYFLIPLLLFSLPLQNIFLTTFPMQVGGQLLIFPFLLFFLFILPHQERINFFARIKPLILPAVLFPASLFLAYFISGNLKNPDWAFLLTALGSTGYGFLACIYCRDIKDIKKLMWVLVVIGVIQLPVLYAMSRGWMENLPGPLSSLSVQSWGGVASPFGTEALRYPGLFGDYEILAEYLDLMILFCLGISFFASSKWEKIISILLAIFMIAAGFYTGTRAFIVGPGVGALVYLFYFITHPRYWNKAVYFLMLVVLLALSIYYLSSQPIFTGYIDRFLNTDISGGYFDTREAVWVTSLIMLRDLPLTGYGAQTMEIFDRIAGDIYLSPHSLLFSMILKAGLPGLVALLVMVCTPLWILLRILLRLTKRAFQPFAVVFLSLWVFWITNEIKMEFIRTSFYMDVIFLLFGITASYSYLANQRKITEKTAEQNSSF